VQRPNFPQTLTALDQWVCWRLEDGKKIPYNPHTQGKASSTNAKTWGDYSFVVAACKAYNYTGLGFVFTKETGIVGIDIDHCIEDGKLNDVAAAILAKVPPTFMELSPSGTGLHIFLRGDMPGTGSRNSKTGVEMYNHARYFTMTGNAYNNAPLVVADDDGALAWIHENYIALPKKERKPKQKKKPAGKVLSDDDIIAKARDAAGGDVFAALWAGDWQQEFPSQSEADLALCCRLAFWTAKNAEQIDRMFRTSGLMRDKWDVRHHASGATYGEETISRAIEATEESYGARGDAPVFAYEDRYFRAKGDNTYPLTNFSMQPIEMLVSDDETQMTADLVTVKGETFQRSFATTDFSNLQKFKNLLNKDTISLSYTGSEGDLELLKNFVAELNWPRKVGVKAQGLYFTPTSRLVGDPERRDGRWVYAAPDGGLAAHGKKVGNILQLEKWKAIESGLLTQTCIAKQQLPMLLAWLLDYNELAKTVSVLAWAAGCFIKEHLRRAGIKFPHLFLIGEAGSGKSNTLERVILPIFSQSKVTAASQISGFTLMKESASSNLVPQPLDEFKPSKMDKTKLGCLYNHFRDSYDGHQGQRGRADQSIVYYDLLAPLVVAGEESPDEAAIRERGIELLFSRRDLKGEGCREAFNKLCANQHLLGNFGRGLLEAALRTESREVKAWYNAALTIFDKNLPPRIVNNLACCAAGLRLVEKLLVLQGLCWDSVFEISFEVAVAHLAFAAREYLLDGSAVNRGIVEQSLEIMARMGLTFGLDWKPLADDTQVAINLKRCYDRFTKYRRDHAITGECLEYRQFTKQLRNSDLFVAYKPVNFNNITTKAYVLNYALLRERCDFGHIYDPVSDYEEIT